MQSEKTAADDNSSMSAASPARAPASRVQGALIDSPSPVSSPEPEKGPVTMLTEREEVRQWVVALDKWKADLASREAKEAEENKMNYGVSQCFQTHKQLRKDLTNYIKTGKLPEGVTTTLQFREKLKQALDSINSESVRPEVVRKEVCDQLRGDIEDAVFPQSPYYWIARVLSAVPRVACESVVVGIGTAVAAHKQASCPNLLSSATIGTGTGLLWGFGRLQYVNYCTNKDLKEKEERLTPLKSLLPKKRSIIFNPTPAQQTLASEWAEQNPAECTPMTLKNN